jgi:hypothetical protein
MGDLVTAALHAWVALASAGRRCDGLRPVRISWGRWLIHNLWAERVAGFVI